MSNEQHKNLVRKLYKAIDDNDLETLEELLSPELVVHNPDPQTRDDMIRGITRWRTIFSGNHLEILEQLCDGDVVITRVIMHADHTEGAFQSVAPSGKHIKIRAVSFERIDNGEIIERRIISDRADMMWQLGLIPPK